MKTRKPDDQAEGSGEISVREAGARGGRSTLARRGKDFFREIGAKGGKRQKELYSDLLAEFGRLGGRPQRPNLENSLGGEPPEKKEADAVGPRGSSPT